jgi:hypothetical protein
VKNRESSYTISKLRCLSRRFRRENRLIWSGFCSELGDYEMVAVCQVRTLIHCDTRRAAV